MAKLRKTKLKILTFALYDFFLKKRYLLLVLNRINRGFGILCISYKSHCHCQGNHG